MTKTIAQNLIKRFDLIEREERDYRCNQTLLAGFIETCNYLSIDSFKQDCRSYDSTRCYKFKDGSALLLANPNQSSYPAYVSEMGTPYLKGFDKFKEGLFY